MMNNRSKILSATHLVLALVLLFVSLYFLSTALAFDRRQGFVPPTLKYDAAEGQYLVMNMKIPLLILITSLFGIGWLCEGFSESLVLKNNRKSAAAVFYVPVLLQVVFFIGMTQVSIDFIKNALLACGFIVISGFYLRYSMMSPEALAKFS